MSNYTKGLMLVFSTAIISGISIFLNRFALQKIDSNILTSSRNLIVAMLLLGIIAGTSKYKELMKLKKSDWLKLLLVGLIGGSIPFILFFKGLTITSAASGSFIHKTMFIFAGIMATAFLKEKNKGFFRIAILILGANLIFLAPELDNFNSGHLLILIATLFWAAENVYSKHLLKNMDGTVLAFGRMFFGSFFIFTYLPFTGVASDLYKISAEQWWWILLTSVFLLGYLLTWYNGLKHVPVSLATSILLLGAPVTTILNNLQMNTIPKPAQITSLLTMTVAIALFAYINAKTKRKTAG